MTKYRKKRKCSIISFISGKGGVGKTSLTASVGKLLSLMNYKVLVVDSDLITHGMTFLLGFDGKKNGILEICKNYIDFIQSTKDEKETEVSARNFVDNASENIICEIERNFHFLQSTSLPSEKYSEFIFTEGEDIALVVELILEKFIKSRKYDFILIDTQAGSVKTTETMASLSTKVVTVMEPDPVATYATENVYGELRDVLPPDSFYLINKFTVEQASAYEAIERFLKILNHLPPVPFDFDVRRSFMVRTIPVNEKDPSSFMFGIIRMLRDLLPEISEKLTNFEKKLEEISILPIKEKMDNIEQEIDEIATVEVDIKNELSLLNNKGRNPLLALRPALGLAVIVSVLASVGFYISILLGDSEYASLLIQLIFGVAVGAIALLITFSVWRKTSKSNFDEISSLEKQLAILREQQNRLRGEYNSFQNLYVTRSKELTLPVKDEKEK